MKSGTRKAAKLNDSMLMSLSYVTSQALNIALQFLIAKTEGDDFYASIGLAYALVTTTVFLGELGYTHYFLRETKARTNWQDQWRAALLHKIVAITILSTLVYCYLTTLSDNHRVLAVDFFFAALPGIYLSIYNCTPILIAQGKTTKAASITPIQIGSYAIISFTVLLTAEHDKAFLLGLSLSASQFIQAAISLLHIQSFKLLLPNLTLSPHQLKSALNIWQLGLVGTIYDRSLMVFIERLHPSLLPAYLLLNQVFQGVSGGFGHIQKIHIRDFSLSDKNTAKGASNLQQINSRYSKLFTILNHIAIVSALVLAFSNWDLAPFSIETAALMSYISSEWTASLIGMIAVSAIIAKHQEHLLRKIVSTTQIASLCAQIIAYIASNINHVLSIRLFSGLILLIVMHKAINIKENRATYLFIAGSIIVPSTLTNDYFSPLLLFGSLFSAMYLIEKFQR